MARRALVSAVVAIVVATCTSPAAAMRIETVRYEQPVDAPVADPFRPPAHRYGPGNRGIDYATPPGTVVRAAADGEVIFAGSVAGTLHVTVLHPDGLRSSYSFLARIDVQRGDALRRGDALGTSRRRLHFGIRDAEGTYLDPSALLRGDAPLQVRLIPGADEGEPPLREERSTFLQLVIERGRSAWAHASVRARLAAHYAVELRLDVRVGRVVDSWTAPSPPCTSLDHVPAPAVGRVAVLVGGLGSTSRSAAVDEIDMVSLGFASEDVLRFSYSGGRVPDPQDGPSFTGIPANDYDAVATTGDLERAADRLTELLVQVASARPGQPIDVIGHSQGGVVARLAVGRASTSGRLPADVRTLATLASPHQGADLATAAQALGGRLGPVPPAGLTSLLGHPVDSSAVAQLSEVSALQDRLARHPLPGHLHTVSIAARGDLVVPLPRTVEAGMPSSVVSIAGLHAHDRLPGSPEAARELALAIGGRPPTCRSSADRLADLVAGEGVSWATDMLAAGGAASATMAPRPR